MSEGLYLVDGGSCMWLIVGRQCPLTLLSTVFKGFEGMGEDALGQGLGPGQGQGLPQDVNSYNNSGYSNSSYSNNTSSAGMTEVAMVPAAAVADRPRLSCAALLYPPSDPHNNDSDVTVAGHGYIDGGNASTSNGYNAAVVASGNTAGVSSNANAGGAAVNLGQQLALLVKHLRERSRTKQELRVVWSDEYGSTDSDRLGIRLVEDR